LGRFNVKVGEVDIFKLTLANGRTSDYNEVIMVNFAVSKM